MRSLCIALLSAAALLVVPSLASAAFTVPATMSTAGQNVTEPQVATSSTGVTHAVWTRSDGSNLIVQYALISAGGVAGPAQDLSVAGQSAESPQIAVDDTGVTHVVWARSNGTHGIIQHVSISMLGVVSSVDDLSAVGQNAASPQLAIDSTGITHVVWIRSNGSHTIVQHVAIDAGGTVGSVVDVSPAGAHSTQPVVSVESTGITHVAWRIAGVADTIQHAAISELGVVGSVDDLSAAGQSGMNPQIAISDTDVTHVVWRRYNGAEFVAQHVSISAGTVSPTDTLSAAGQAAENPQVDVSPAGVTHVVWERSDGADTRVQHVAISAGGVVGSVVELSAAGESATTAQLAISDLNITHVVWVRFNGSENIVQHVAISAAGAIGSTDNLSSAGQGAGAPQVAVHASGDVYAVWYRSDGSNTLAQEAHEIAAPTADLSDASYDFGNQTVSAGPSATKTFTITNNGVSDLNVSAVALSAANLAEFVVGADTCTGTPVVAAGTCTIDVTFDPLSHGAKAASLDITSDAPSSVDSIALTGTGVAPTMTLSDLAHDFGDQAVDAGPTATKTFTVTNTGTIPLNVSTVFILEGVVASRVPAPSSTAFLKVSETCTAGPIAVAGTCTIGVQFDPDSIGLEQATFGVYTDAMSSVTATILSGTGTDPCSALVAPGCSSDQFILGTSGDDRLFGGDGVDTMMGVDGNDRLHGGDRGDALIGGRGKDHLDGDDGDDQINGGSGRDSLNGGDGRDTISGGSGKDSINGGAGKDTINVRGHSRDIVDCGAGKDTVYADRADELINCERVRYRDPR